MHKFHLADGVKDQLAKAAHLHTQGINIKVSAGWILHPAVGVEDPQGRDIGTKRDQPGDHQVLVFG